MSNQSDATQVVTDLIGMIRRLDHHPIHHWTPQAVEQLREAVWSIEAAFDLASPVDDRIAGVQYRQRTTMTDPTGKQLVELPVAALAGRRVHWPDKPSDSDTGELIIVPINERLDVLLAGCLIDKDRYRWATYLDLTGVEELARSVPDEGRSTP